MSRVINFFGAPSSGKSTIAFGLAYIMKKNHYNVEVALEKAKELVAENDLIGLEDQLSITANQNRRVARWIGKADCIITDSPCLIGIFYKPKDYYKDFDNLILDIFNKQDNINFFINRKYKYQPAHRLQTEQESDIKAKEIKNFLISNKIQFYEFDCDGDPAARIFDFLVKNSMLQS